MFEKFSQVKCPGAGNRASTGLGLPFCKMAAEAHGGAISLESDLRRGSVFRVSIPLRAASPPLAEIEAPIREAVLAKKPWKQNGSIPLTVFRKGLRPSRRGASAGACAATALPLRPGALRGTAPAGRGKPGPRSRPYSRLFGGSVSQPSLNTQIRNILLKSVLRIDTAFYNPRFLLRNKMKDFSADVVYARLRWLSFFNDLSSGAFRG
ncbi:MAG: ATP-binding protein [Opitutaceae bacterium]